MATKKAKKGGKLATPKIPAGFTPVDVGGAFGGGSHDFRKQPILTGTVVSVDTVKVSDPDNAKKKISRRVMRVKSGAVTSSVWESHQLREVFDAAKKGKQVFLQFLGQESIKGGRKLNRFAAAIK